MMAQPSLKGVYTQFKTHPNGKPIPIKAETVYRDVTIRYVENREGILPPRSFMPDELANE